MKRKKTTQLSLGVPPPTAHSARDIGEPKTADGTDWRKPPQWGDIPFGQEILYSHHSGWRKALALNIRNSANRGWLVEHPVLLVRDVETGAEYEVEILDSIRIQRTGHDAQRRMG